MNKKTVLILFGGQSEEHDVSLMSSVTIIKGLNREKYYIITVGITRDGRWLLYSGDTDKILSGEWEKYGTPAVLTPDCGRKVLIKIVNDKVKSIPIDVVFPVLHGKKGEDGTVQGLLEMLDIPYVGCGVFASAAAMDKSIMKKLASLLNINQTPHLDVRLDDLKCHDTLIGRIEQSLSYPIFVKPSNYGSSIGISRVSDREFLIAAIENAFKFDDKVIVEQGVTGLELECSVLGGKDVYASSVGQIIAGASFYDYDAKYINEGSQTVIPAPIPKEVSDEIRETAIKVFKCIGGYGISRVDFFYDDINKKVYFNEINTMPGFTKISMYPMLLAYDGKKLNEVVDTLIELAFDRKKK